MIYLQKLGCGFEMTAIFLIFKKNKIPKLFLHLVFKAACIQHWLEERWLADFRFELG